MENRRLMWAAGVSGAVFAISVAVFAWQLSVPGQQAGGADRAEPRVDVMTCASSIDAGDAVTDMNVTPKAVPKSLIPEGAILAEDFGKAKGRRVGTNMVRGEILTESRVSQSVSPLDGIRSGHTAVTVAVDPVRALGGEVTPGMKVDLKIEQAIGGVVEIASAIRIISTSVREAPREESSIMSAPSGASADIAWVTLEVPDESVNAVVAASGAGSVYLVFPASTDGLTRG